MGEDLFVYMVCNEMFGFLFKNIVLIKIVLLVLVILEKFEVSVDCEWVMVVCEVLFVMWLNMLVV